MKLIKSNQRSKIVLNNSDAVYLIDFDGNNYSIAATHMGGYKKVLFTGTNLVQLCTTIKNSGLQIISLYL